MRSIVRLSGMRLNFQAWNVLPIVTDTLFTSPAARNAATQSAAVVVVVPVYRDCELTCACLASAMPGVMRHPNARLVAINDASPDAGMDDALASEARRWGEKLVILRNEVNLGFVKTANRGIRYDAAADVILLNNDVILPDQWLERIVEDAEALADAGTVTPLSNNTTISSFPNFVADNASPLQLNIEQIDQVFGAVRLNPVDAPTGIGFCMYIKRRCLDEVGELDEQSFGTGYGEENDFCQRALRKGWKSYISPNLYVHHRGGVSFGDQRTARIRHADQMLDRRYPNYHADVQSFVAKDELRRARLQRYFDLMRVRGLPIVLHVSHGLGGGVEEHIRDLSRRCEGRLVSLVLRPEDGGRLVSIGAWDADSSMRIAVDAQQGLALLLSFLKTLGVDLIHYHHVLGLSADYLSLGASLGVRQIFTVHDFYLISANPTLTDEHGVFDAVDLDRAHNPLYPLPKGVTREAWRDRYRRFLAACERVIYPSHSTFALFGGFFEVRNPLLAYHPEDIAQRDCPHRPFTRKDRYTVGVLGALSREKGANLLEAAAALAASRQSKVSFTLIGYAYRPLQGVKTTGPYKSACLAELIDSESCDLIAFPALWPETYSYTLSSALASGLPIVAPGIGAFPERLAGREQTALFAHPPTADTLLAAIESLLTSLEHGAQSRAPEFAGERPRADYYEQQYVRDAGPARGQMARTEMVAALDALSAAQEIVVHGVRERVLRVLWGIYTDPRTQAVSRLIPHRMKRAVKRLLSRRPLHEVIR
ncbi:TPA: glycosyltransferase [Burkholderia vietnamiensis]|uniref:glycosyltransferase n=1 Tax=Burkholderia vietnamiensis TaxID=60552 RepID=UPI00159410FA|nr:glycosyltransferase [Burkholderia vietnamiensis]MCA8212103.1 glycosyltransferase [Burkholderia vietnamiensis]HDR9102766.1 glycosyltransferase [Burkholderia vietnamiensis]HDR9122579.1 glycosyltransferase [Burkholderia vietnamiensis]HDR9172541.1 glycosyltransferase [Burkholderia vietnamiensis]HDR9284832.1 glycosyltransferase [Burkholderia vietnamiensis]